MFRSGSTRTVAWPIVLTGAISSLVLVLGITPTFAAFTASIGNSINAAGTGTLVMQETNAAGTVTCLSTDGGSVSTNVAACSSINKYGGNLGMTAGSSAVTVANIKNVGTVDAVVFGLTPGVCAQSATGAVAGTAVDLCAKITVTITSGASTIFTGTAEALGGGGPINLLSKLGVAKLVPSTQKAFTITATIDAGVGNTYQGLQVSQPMTWTFSS
jgi:hypothetical protein